MPCEYLSIGKPSQSRQDRSEIKLRPVLMSGDAKSRLRSTPNARNVQGVARDVTRALVSRRKAPAVRIRGVRESHIIVPFGVVMRGFSQQMCQLD
jgi:hypothetical protein